MRKSRFLTFVSYDNRQPFQFHIFYSFIFASSCLSLHFCLILFVSSFLSHLVCLFIFVSSCLSLHFCLFRGVLGLTVTFRSLSKTGLSNSIVSLILNSYLNFQFIDVCLKKEMFLSLKREMFEKRNGFVFEINEGSLASNGPRCLMYNNVKIKDRKVSILRITM